MEEKAMIVGIMQPYFFPYFEQFRLISACEKWVVFDTAQFTRKTWITRNRILNREKGLGYISVPIRHTGQVISINEAPIDNDQNWRGKVMDRLKPYHSEAPQYEVVREFVGDTLTGEFESVATLNTVILKAVCNYLGIATPILIASKLAIAMPDQCEPGEWALHISKSLGASEYRNAAGGRSLFDEELYANNGINLSFHEHTARKYSTGGFDFKEDLSIIDWMMWNDRKTLQDWLA
jgi:hypothetical protein